MMKLINMPESVDLQTESDLRIALVLPYFGRWPVWLPAFLLSCKYNPIDWLLFSDCGEPSHLPRNVHYIPMTLQDIKKLAEDQLKTAITLAFPYKLCELRPAYGRIFAQYLSGYDFWGHCDLDVIWGDISHWITPNLLEKYDILSARRHRMCGHFSLYRNVEAVNHLFEGHPHWAQCFDDVAYHRFDEDGMTEVVTRAADQGIVRVYWPRFLFNFADAGDREPTIMKPWRDRWQWKAGKVYDIDQEVMYLHFQRWKKSMKRCEIRHDTHNQQFFISFGHCTLESGRHITLSSWVSWYHMRILDYWHAAFDKVRYTWSRYRPR